nr:hypothetical protein [uncultured Fluviicola sp.]
MKQYRYLVPVLFRLFTKSGLLVAAQHANMNVQETSYVNRLKSTSQTDTLPVYSVKCINLSDENLYFYFFQRSPDQLSGITSLAWCVSEYKVPGNGSFTFTWEETYSYFWQGYGSVQPPVVFDAQGMENAAPETAITFSIDDDTPNFSDLVQANIPGMQVTTKFTVPDNKFGVGIGMSGVATFLTQAIPNTQQQFDVTPIYYIACSENIATGTILSESSTDPKLILVFPNNIYNLILTYQEGKFTQS